MCFSATASFSISAVLIPIGIYTLIRSRQLKAKELKSGYLALAFIPFIFGLQQFIEGFVWYNYYAGNEATMHAFGRGFIFFSHFFWMIWIPLTAWLMESQQQLKRIFFSLMVTGFILGMMVYLPILLQDGRLEISIIEHSIYYETHLITHEYISKNTVRFGYAVIVLLPLLLSSSKLLRHYGMWTALATVITVLFFEYAFVSVWCFFAAFLSLYILAHVLRQESCATH